MVLVPSLMSLLHFCLIAAPAIATPACKLGAVRAGLLRQRLCGATLGRECSSLWPYFEVHHCECVDFGLLGCSLAAIIGVVSTMSIPFRTDELIMKSQLLVFSVRLGHCGVTEAADAPKLH